MNAATITKALKGHRSGRGYVARCPAHDDRNPSLSIRDGDNGCLLVHCFKGCSPASVFAALSAMGLWEKGGHRGQFLRRARPIERRHNSTDDDFARILVANRSFAEAIPIKGTAGEIYFRNRGISPATLEISRHALKFAPQRPTWLPDGAIRRFGAVIAQMRDVRTDQPRAIHRTFLEGGRKADLPGGAKRMLGPAAGCAIKLSRDEDVIDGLGIAEGLETALSVLQTGWGPVWALGSAGSIENFPVLGGIEALTIWADADEAGLRAARICQARWAEAGRECRILLPPQDGTDWNDVVGAAA
jgi:hypothetical protein